MSEKTTVPVVFENLPANEKLIFKLIFSVSERSRNRSHQYGFSTAQTDSPCVVITGNKPANDASDSTHLVVQVCDKTDVAAGPAIVRPLIATRVLSALDKLIQDNHFLEALHSGAQNAAEQHKPAQTESSAAGAAEDGLVEFSISEEEASELAIVHDDTLANPANKEATLAEQQGADAAEQHATATEQTGAAAARPVSQGKIQTALVVDDSASVRKQLEIELDLFQVEVDYAEDAERALDLLGKKNYDVAFLDVVLPDMDGFQICKKIKSDKDSKATKVIMLTGKASHADKVRGSLAGCDAYMVKPVGRTTFQATVKKFLKPIENVEVMEA